MPPFISSTYTHSWGQINLTVATWQSPEQHCTTPWQLGWREKHGGEERRGGENRRRKMDRWMMLQVHELVYHFSLALNVRLTKLALDILALSHTLSTDSMPTAKVKWDYLTNSSRDDYWHCERLNMLQHIIANQRNNLSVTFVFTATVSPTPVSCKI